MKLLLIFSSLFILLSANDKLSQTALIMEKYEAIYNDVKTKTTYTSRFDEEEIAETKLQSTESINRLVSESFIQKLLSKPLVKIKEPKPIIEEIPIIIKETVQIHLDKEAEEALVKKIVSISTHKVPKNNTFFLALSYNSVFFNVNSSINNIDTSGYSLEFQCAYYINKNTFITSSYERTILSDISINNFSTSINYQYNKIYGFKPYLGLIFGYGFLTWEKSIFETTGNKSVTASGISTGIKIGVEKALDDSFSYYLSYKYILTDFHTSLSNSTNTSSININHNNQHTIGLGIRYNF